MPLSATREELQDLGAQAAEVGAAHRPEKEEPKPVDVSAKEMEPRARAGVQLAIFVLVIVTGAVLLLIATLLWFGFRVTGDVRDAYAQVLNPSRIGSEFYTLGRLEHLMEDLGSAQRDPNWQMTDTSRDNEAQVMAFLARLPSVTSEQKAALARCNPIPTGTTRNDLVQRCISVLNDIREAALEAAASINNAQIAAESADKMLAHRQSLFTFWIQAAQLILLNLLLPLLTALFGYIFGSQQAAQRS